MDAEQIKSLATSVNRVVQNHTRPLRVKIERLQAVNKDLLDLLNDIADNLATMREKAKE